MWALEECGPASEWPKDAAIHWDFKKYLAARIQDYNLYCNQNQGNFKCPVRYLHCLSKLTLLPLNSNTELQAGAEFTSPQMDT